MPVVSPNKLVQQMAMGDWDLSLQLLNQDPTLAQGRSPCPGFFGDEKVSDIFPIHQAVASHAPVHFLKALIDAHPRGVSKEESAYRRTPLHIACRNGSMIETIALLLHYDKDAAAHQDNMGRIPLHYALSNGGSPEIVNALLQASPISVSATDNGGWTPLHVACNQGCSYDIVETLLNADEEGIIATTKTGSTPVILAEKAESPDKERILELLKTNEHKMTKKTEFVRIRNAEKKATEKEKNAVTVRKVSNRGSVRTVV